MSSMGKRPVSSSEDEDEEMQKRLRSCVSMFPSGGTAANGSANMQDGRGKQELKHYQVRLQDMLHQQLDKTIEICSVDNVPAGTVPEVENNDCGGFQLFAKAPPGITVTPASPPPGVVDEAERPNIKKPYRHTLKRWRSSGKDSFKQAAVDGELVKAEARKALAKTLSKWKTNLQRKDEAVAKENRRIAMLKRERGEAWLPSQRTA